MVVVLSDALKFKISPYGFLGVFFYFVLSMPVIRNYMFGEKIKILDVFSGQAEFGGDVVVFLGQAVLVVPYFFDKYFFSHFDIGGFNLAVFFIFIPIVYRYFSFSIGIFSFAFLLFMFFPAPLLFLSTFNKETFLVLSLFFAFGYGKGLEVRDNSYVFVVYSVLMRPYLLWLPFVMKVKRFFHMVSFLLLCFFILLNFEYSRNVVFKLFNRRLAEKYEDANSEIVQSVYVSSVADVFYVLIEVLPQIIFPFFMDLNVKNFVFQVYVTVFLFVCVSFRNKYSNVLVFLFCLYVVLDPDLGAFFRHVSSFFILFPLAVGLKVFHDKERQPYLKFN